MALNTRQARKAGMRRLVRLVIAVAVGSVAWTAASMAQTRGVPQYRYHYVSLAGVVPEGYTYIDWFFSKIRDNGRIFSSAWSCNDDFSICLPSVVSYWRGAATVLQEGIVRTANSQGLAGGGALFDPINFTTQAALFEGRRRILLPRLEG